MTELKRCQEEEQRNCVLRMVRGGGRSMIKLPDKELFRADEVQSLFGLRSVTTVYGWIRAGKVKYVVTPGGRKRIPRSEVERITMELRANPVTLL